MNDYKNLIKRFNVVIEDIESLHLKISRDEECVARVIDLLYGLMNDVYSEMCAYSLKTKIKEERTCHDQFDIPGKWHCSYCNYLINFTPKYCPHCGGKVVK